MRSQREKVDRLGVRKEQGEEEGGTGSIRAEGDLQVGMTWVGAALGPEVTQVSYSARTKVSPVFFLLYFLLALKQVY